MGSLWPETGGPTPLHHNHEDPSDQRAPASGLAACGPSGNDGSPAAQRTPRHQPPERTAVHVRSGPSDALVGLLFQQADRHRAAGPIPVQALTREALLAAPDGSLYRLGHSTLLFKLRGRFWLTDPVFSERSSPVQWFGPKRFHAPPIRVEELPPIER